LFETRLEELKRLASLGESHSFYNELSESLREYLKAKWEVVLPSGEHDRDEVLSQVHVPESVQEQLKEICRTCDLVKFAGTRPSSIEMAESLSVLYDIINALKQTDKNLSKGADE
jgi:hypothetical protein